jgi:hypothetical protein
METIDLLVTHFWDFKESLKRNLELNIKLMVPYIDIQHYFEQITETSSPNILKIFLDEPSFDPSFKNFFIEEILSYYCSLTRFNH